LCLYRTAVEVAIIIESSSEYGVLWYGMVGFNVPFDTL